MHETSYQYMCLTLRSAKGKDVNGIMIPTKEFVRSGVRTHAHIRGPECSTLRKQGKVHLESGALDHSAILTCFSNDRVLRVDPMINSASRSNGGPTVTRVEKLAETESACFFVRF